MEESLRDVRGTIRHICTDIEKKSEMAHTGEYERSIDFASGIAPVLLRVANRYTSIVDSCRPTFQRKLASSINDGAKATGVAIPTHRCPTRGNNIARKGFNEYDAHIELCRELFQSVNLIRRVC